MIPKTVDSTRLPSFTTYHLVMTNSLPWYRWPIEIDGLPIQNGWIFHLNQRRLTMSHPISWRVAKGHSCWGCLWCHVSCPLIYNENINIYYMTIWIYIYITPIVINPIMDHIYCNLCPLDLTGKRLHNYGKSPFFMGISTIYMAIFNSFLYVYQRVTIIINHY